MLTLWFFAPELYKDVLDVQIDPNATILQLARNIHGMGTLLPTPDVLQLYKVDTACMFSVSA